MDVRVVEGISGVWHYHLAKVGDPPSNTEHNAAGDAQRLRDVANELPPDLGAYAAVCREIATRIEALAATHSAPGEAVGEVYTMEALVPGGEIRHHVALRRPLPAGTLLCIAPSSQPAGKPAGQAVTDAQEPEWIGQLREGVMLASMKHNFWLTRNELGYLLRMFPWYPPKALAPEPATAGETLGRYGHHPDPATDFEIEVERLQGRLFNARHGIAWKAGKMESVDDVLVDIERAMRFRVGGDESAIRAKAILRALESEAKAAPAAAVPEGPLTGKYGDVLRPFVAMMERELHANSGKGDRPGWLAMSPATAMLEIYYHAAKLQKAVKNEGGDTISEYAADVANMAMMMVDICGGLVDVTLAAFPANRPAEAQRGVPLFDLGKERIGKLLRESLKPEEINGSPEVRNDRVHELLCWFARFADGSANPKWATRHAMELAFYIATGGMRPINLDKVRSDAFQEGLRVDPSSQLRKTLLATSPLGRCQPRRQRRA